MRRGIAIWALALLLLGAPAALAEDEPSGGGGDGGSPATPTPLLHGELALSLKDAIAMGVENNLDVEVQRHDPYIAGQRAEGSWGAYDPELFGDWSYGSVENPNTNPLLDQQPGSAVVNLDIVTTRTSEGNGGLRGLVPKIGASYELGYTGSRNTFSTDFFALSPEYRTDLSLSGTLPLMKDFLWSEPWFQVKSTEILSEESYHGFRRVLMDTVFSIPLTATAPGVGIEAAYWDLVAAAEQLRVAEKSVETAQALLEQTEAQYEVGVVSRVEVVESEAGVAQREFDRITAENRYRRAQDQLIDLVLGRNLQPTSRLEIRPTDSPEPIAYQVEADQAAALAFELRPELVIARKEVERLEIQTKFARNQMLPQLDVVGSYGYSGLAGRPNGLSFSPGGTSVPRVQGDIPTRYSSADDDFFSASKAVQWNAGAVFTFPLGNRGARANARIADLELRKAKTRLVRTEQDVILEVRDAIRNLRSAQDGIAAAEARRRATEEQLRAERIRLENGESTPFEVLDREEDLVEAESQKIAALQVYRNSLAELDRAQGTILRNRNVVVDQALTLR